MKVVETALPGVVVLEPRVFRDERGLFFECFHEERYLTATAQPGRFVQDNVSLSAHHVLRGLHLQNPHGQGKLVQVLAGEVLDMVVDVRVGSPHFGRHFAMVLDGESRKQIFVPAGFAHGFLVLSDSALFHYKCTDYYAPACELSLRWNDPDLALPWSVERPTLAKKDAEAPTLSDLQAAGRLPTYGARDAG